MSEQLIETEEGGWINTRYIISVKPAASGFIARFQIGDSTETARLDLEAAKRFIADNAIAY